MPTVASRNPLVEDRDELVRGIIELPDASSAIDGHSQKVYELYRERNEVLKTIIHGADDQLMRDPDLRLEALVDNPRFLIKKNYPLLYSRLLLVTNSRFRILVVICVVWATVQWLAITGVVYPNCQGVSTILVVYRYSIAVYWWANLTVFLLIPMVWTNKLNGSLEREVQSSKLGMDVCHVGYYRLLEAKLKSIVENDSSEDAAAIPKEGFAARMLLLYWPVFFIALTYGVFIFAMLDTFSKSNPMMVGMSSAKACLTQSDLVAMTAISLCHIPETIAYTVPFLANLVCFYGLNIGTQLTRTEITAWTNRVTAIKHVTVEDLARHQLTAGKAKTRTRTRTSREIRTDAYARYLLLHRMIRRSSQLWSVYLTVSLGLYTVCFLLYTGLTVITFNQPLLGGWLIPMWQVFFMLQVCVVLFIVANANALNRNISDSFVFSVPLPGDSSLVQHQNGLDSIPFPSANSSNPEPLPPHTHTHTGTAVAHAHPEGDYTLIGGRREWLLFVHSAPIQWTISGVPITFDRLSAAVITGAVSLSLSLLSKIAGALQQES